MGIPIIGDVIDAVKDIVSEVVVDVDKKNEIIARIDERVHLETMAQLEINKTEAASSNIFVAGWRPFTGWVGGVGLAYSAILEPFSSWIAKVVFGYTGTFPVINNELLLYVLGGMLGLGAMRSYDKVKRTDTITTKIVTPAVEVVKKQARRLLPENAPWTK